MVRIGIDVGGTFTDLVAVDDLGRATLEKVPSTPDDSSIGVLDGLALLARRLGRQRAALLAETDRIVHGTTVAIHALLERSGAHVGLFTTEGHRDVIVMREGLRDDRPAEGCARSRRRVVVRASSALVFEGGAAGFGGEAAALGGEGGLGRAAGGRGQGGAADQRDQAVERVLAVALLGAEAAGGDHDDAVLGQAAAGEARRPLAHLRRQGRGTGEVEAQLHRGRELVDVLSAGAGGADKAFLDLAVIEDHIAYYRYHGAAQRGIVGGRANIALHAAWDGSVIEDDAVPGACPRCGRTASAFFGGPDRYVAAACVI
jgi:hypothetical protein